MSAEQDPAPGAPSTPAPHEHATPLDEAIFSWGWMILSLISFFAVELIIYHQLGPALRQAIEGADDWASALLMVGVAGFWLVGLLIGWLSPQVRVLEPALGAFIAVVSTHCYIFYDPTLGLPLRWAMLAGSSAFILSIVGAELGERLGAARGNEASKAYLG